MRRTTEDAAIAVQNAARVIPPGHELYGQWLRALASCERCYRTELFSYSNRFALVELAQTREREEPPKPATQDFATYSEAYVAMQRHAESCTGVPGRTAR